MGEPAQTVKEEGDRNEELKPFYKNQPKMSASNKREKRALAFEEGPTGLANTFFLNVINSNQLNMI